MDVTYNRGTRQAPCKPGPLPPAFGFSLVELMIAMTISLILLAGLVQIFTGSKHNWFLQTQFAQLQENGRYAIQSLDGSVRMAAHWGGVETADLLDRVDAGVVRGRNQCDQQWILNVHTGIRGYDGAATVGKLHHDVSTCIRDYVPHSDVLVVRYASTDGMVDTSDNIKVLRDRNTVWVRTTARGFGAVLDSYHDINPLGPELQEAPGTYNFPYRISVFFLRPCNVRESNRCRNGIPTLTHLTLSGTRLIEEALVDNIEMVQYFYGLDLNSDGDAEEYRSASGIAPALWGKVISVQINMVVRSESPDPSYTDRGRYTLFDGTALTPSGRTIRYHRKLFGRVVQIRNRTRG